MSCQFLSSRNKPQHPGDYEGMSQRTRRKRDDKQWCLEHRRQYDRKLEQQQQLTLVIDGNHLFQSEEEADESDLEGTNLSFRTTVAGDSPPTLHILIPFNSGHKEVTRMIMVVKQTKKENRGAYKIVQADTLNPSVHLSTYPLLYVHAKKATAPTPCPIAVLSHLRIRDCPQATIKLLLQPDEAVVNHVFANRHPVDEAEARHTDSWRSRLVYEDTVAADLKQWFKDHVYARRIAVLLWWESPSSPSEGFDPFYQEQGIWPADYPSDEEIVRCFGERSSFKALSRVRSEKQAEEEARLKRHQQEQARQEADNARVAEQRRMDEENAASARQDEERLRIENEQRQATRALPGILKLLEEIKTGENQHWADEADGLRVENERLEQEARIWRLEKQERQSRREQLEQEVNSKSTQLEQEKQRISHLEQEVIKVTTSQSASKEVYVERIADIEAQLKEQATGKGAYLERIAYLERGTDQLEKVTRLEREGQNRIAQLEHEAKTSRDVCLEQVAQLERQGRDKDSRIAALEHEAQTADNTKLERMALLEREAKTSAQLALEAKTAHTQLVLDAKSAHGRLVLEGNNLKDANDQLVHRIAQLETQLGTEREVGSRAEVNSRIAAAVQARYIQMVEEERVIDAQVHIEQLEATRVDAQARSDQLERTRLDAQARITHLEAERSIDAQTLAKSRITAAVQAHRIQRLDDEFKRLQANHQLSINQIEDRSSAELVKVRNKLENELNLQHRKDEKLETLNNEIDAKYKDLVRQVETHSRVVADIKAEQTRAVQQPQAEGESRLAVSAATCQAQADRIDDLSMRLDRTVERKEKLSEWYGEKAKEHGEVVGRLEGRLAQQVDQYNDVLGKRADDTRLIAQLEVQVLLAKKHAGRIKQLEEQLEAGYRELSVANSNLQQGWEAANAMVESKDAELVAADNACAEAMRELQDKTSRYDEATSALLETQSSLAKHKSSLAKAQSDKAALEKDKAALLKNKAALQKDKAALEKKAAVSVGSSGFAIDKYAMNNVDNFVLTPSRRAHDALVNSEGKDPDVVLGEWQQAAHESQEDQQSVDKLADSLIKLARVLHVHVDTKHPTQGYSMTKALFRHAASILAELSTIGKFARDDARIMGLRGIVGTELLILMHIEIEYYESEWEKIRRKVKGPQGG